MSKTNRLRIMIQKIDVAILRRMKDSQVGCVVQFINDEWILSGDGYR